MKKRIAVPMLILIVICTLVLADDSYEPYLHRADVAQGPELSELGSYSTDSYSGSASYTIEIDVPSGRNGLQPVLGLNYNSHITKSKPTVFGTGWSMTESYILRDVNHTVTDQSDDEYRLSLFGRGYKLVYNGTWNTKVDQNLKIQNYSEYWTVNTPEGSLYRLGYNDDSKLESNQDDFVVKWYLDTINDTHDDIIGYSYLQNPVVGDNGSIYLDEITYTHNKIKFNYEQRPDIWTSFNNGITEVMSWIVSDISVFSDDDLVRRYGISYIHQTDSRTMIEQVSVYGLDNTTISYRTNFTYEIPKAGWTSNSTWDPPMVFVTSTGGDKGARFVDVNGDGLPDVIQSAYGIGSAAYINTGNGWVSNSTWNPPILFIEESQRDQGTRIADVNGDGLPDIIQRAYGYGSSAYINTGSGWTSNSTWNPPIEFLNSDGDDKGTRVADVNGDGFPDFIQNAYGQGSSAYMNTGSGWVSNSSWVPPVEFITEYGRDKGTRIVDVNGDGLPDIIQEAYGLGDSAYLNTGNGWIRNDSFDPPIEFLSSTGGDKGTRLADVNGDGLPDIIQSKYGEGSSAYMNTGTGWSRNDSFQPPIEFIDSSGQNKGTRLADVNGDGLVDIIQSKYGGGSSAYTQKGSHNHYLIKAVTTYGGETVLSYLPSTSIDNTGSDEISDLSYNMWLVQNETIYNGMDTISSTIYNYSGGLFDYEDREFRGFAYSIGEKADGSTIEHYYHQSDALQGKEYKTEIKNSSGDLYLRSENYWSYEDGDYFIVELDGSATSQYDGTNNPKVTNTSYTYDDYGNVLTIDYSGIKSEVYEYVYNLNDWVVDKVKHYQLKDTNVIAESWYAYDNQSNGTAPSKGDLTQKVDYLNTGTNPVTSYNYDSFGNLIWETDPNGETTYYVYGLNDTTYTFPEQVINPKGHIFETRYDLGTGNILWKKDPNNVYTNYSYDVFGRIIKEIRPYDSSSLPTTEYEYSLDGTAPEKVVVKNGDVNVSYFYDGFGQIMQAKTSSENGQAVTDYYFDENMRVSAVSNPYFVSYSNSYTTPAGTEFLNYTYDVLDRVVVVNNLDSTEKKIEFSVYNITAYDENDNKKKYTVDELDKITSVFEYLDDIEYETTYEYDVLGNVISITDSLNNEFVFTFDSLSRKTGIDDPDLGVWNYSYDSNGNLITQLDARGEVVSLGYDSINRLIEKNSSEDSIDYSYDTVIGTLSSVSGNFGSISFDYDDRLRLTGRDITLDGTTFNTHYSYDSQDRISSKTLHDGTVIDYTYDKQGLLDSIGSVVDNIDYTAAGLKTLISYGNGLDSEYSYSYNRLSRLKTSSLQDLNYEYDSVGNILEINNKINSKNRSMTYDDL
ncbi:FG-GAP-like repeat-containing protein, partial [Candidatus Woesearchaeota archaeon]|nr:FG-GAP-like repeat-containing protein [Candidatus Woesearchaeota archaeon]